MIRRLISYSLTLVLLLSLTASSQISNPVGNSIAHAAIVIGD